MLIAVLKVFKEWKKLFSVFCRVNESRKTTCGSFAASREGRPMASRERLSHHQSDGQKQGEDEHVA